MGVAATLNFIVFHSLQVPDVYLDVYAISQTAKELASQSPVCLRMSQVLSSCTRMCATTLHTWKLQRSASQPQAGFQIWVADGNIKDNSNIYIIVISAGFNYLLYPDTCKQCDHNINSLYGYIGWWDCIHGKSSHVCIACLPSLLHVGDCMLHVGMLCRLGLELQIQGRDNTRVHPCHRSRKLM